MRPVYSKASLLTFSKLLINFGDFKLITATKAGIPTNIEIRLTAGFGMIKDVMNIKLIFRRLKRNTINSSVPSFSQKIQYRQLKLIKNSSANIIPVTEKETVRGKKKATVNSIEYMVGEIIPIFNGLPFCVRRFINTLLKITSKRIYLF